jgi:PKD repeat protein
MKKIILAAITLIFINACSKKDPVPTPTVNFYYTGANVPAPAIVSFTSSSTNATSYLWDFGDNGSSALANPEHLYSAGGVYTVKLTATGAGGSTSTTKTVNIGAALTKVKITKITITALPFITGTGAGWDPSDGPDVFFKITNQSNTVLFDATSSSKVNDVAPSSLPIAWTLATPFEITDLTAPKFINLWDYDTFDADDNIGYVGFLMSNYTSGSNAYPQTVTQTQNGITITLNLTWY